MGKYLPEFLYPGIRREPFFLTPSSEYVKYKWEFSAWLGRLQPCPVGSRKYTLSKTRRIQNKELRDVVNLFVQYPDTYSAAIANYAAAYQNKFRYDRDPNPERSLPIEWQRLMEPAFQRTVRRYANALDGSKPMTVLQVIDQLDLDKSCGFPWKLRFANKREFLTQCEGWDPLNVLSTFLESLDSDETMFYVLWMDKLKDEIRLKSKLAANKIRTFNISPIEMVIADNMYGLDFNQNFYREGSKITNWNVVAMTKYSGTWNRLIHKHLKIGPKNTFSADGGEWDARMFRWLMDTCRRIRQIFTEMETKYKRRIASLYLLSVVRMVYGELGDILLFFLGNGSGRAHTIVDNTLGHTTVWNLAWEVCLFLDRKDPSLFGQAYQDQHLCLSLCGDDVLVSISDECLKWFYPSRIFSVLSRFGIMMEFEMDEPRHPAECTFLSNVSTLYLGIYIPSPNFDRVVSGLVESAEHDEDNDFEVDPRWTLLRLYAIRIETWGNPKVRELLEKVITQYRKKHRDLFLSTSADYVIRSGVTWSQVSTVYKTDQDISRLYCGFEGGARNSEFPFIFSTSPMAKAFRACMLFDSTLGYPGEGPKHYYNGSSCKKSPPASDASRRAGVFRDYLRRLMATPSPPVIYSVEGKARVDPVDSSFDATLGYPGEGPLSDVFNQWEFEYHGNWGGPNYGGGARTSLGQKPDWRVEPVDELDSYFRRHDYNTTAHGIQYADNLLLQDLEKAGFPGHLGWKGVAAELGFYLKNRVANLHQTGGRVTDHGNYPWDLVGGPEHDWKRGVRIGEASNPGPPKDEQKRAKKVVKKAVQQLKKSAKSAMASAAAKAYRNQMPKNRKVVKRQTPAIKRMMSKAGRFSANLLVREPVSATRLRSGLAGATRLKGTVVLADLTALTITAWTTILGSSNQSVGSTLPYFDLNPYSLAMMVLGGYDNKVSTFCDYFEKWAGKFKFRWKPGVSTSTDGSFVFFVDTDAADRNEAYFTTVNILQRGAEHATPALPCLEKQVFQPFEYPVNCPRRRWLRHNSGTDIRNSSAGHLYAFSTFDAEGVSGQLVLDYDLQLFNPTSKELSFESYYGNPTLATINGNVFVDWSDADMTASYPLSDTVIPYIRDDMAAPSALSTADDIMVLNHGSMTPYPTFVEVHATAAVSTNVTISYYLNGVNVTSTYSTVDVDSPTSQVITVYIPAYTPPDSAQLSVTIANVTTADVAFLFWTLPSVSFKGDFGVLPPTYKRALKHHLNVERMRKRDEEKVVVNLTEDDFKEWHEPEDVKVKSPSEPLPALSALTEVFAPPKKVVSKK